MSRITAEKAPDNSTYLDTFGWILYLQGKALEAKPFFKNAVMLYGGKESPVILDHYAEVLFALKEYDLAFLYWNKAKAINNGEIPDLDRIKVVYIGSVAQCGDRMPPLHWGEAGEPVYASKYDQYSVSKCIAERIIVDSGIRWWVSLRQTGILYPGIFRQLSPTAFHVPLKGVLDSLHPDFRGIIPWRDLYRPDS